MATSYSTHVVGHDVLPHATSEEMLALTRVFDENAEVAESPSKLAAMICSAGGNALGNWLRSQGVPYSEVLHDVAKTLKVAGVQPLNALTATGLSVAEMDGRVFNNTVNSGVAQSWHWPVDAYMQRLEQDILKKFMADSYQRMTPAQRAVVDQQVVEMANRLPGSAIKGLTASAAFLMVANAGGFATYMLMSTAISTLTAGVAGFGVYTAAASILHVLLGPAGIAALGIATIYKLGGPNQQRCATAVLAVAMLRARLDQTMFASIR